MIFQSEQPTLQKRTLDILRFAPLGILVTTTVIFCLGAFRGFEITDESFYFLHYLYSREFFAGVSFFGLYFELPFYLLNGSIPAIRIFGIFLLICASFYFLSQLYSFYSIKSDTNESDRTAFISTGILCAFFYYSYLSGLRAPSYNLLVLICMLISTGALFSVLENPKTNLKHTILSTIYGVAVSVCTFTKPPAGLCLLFFHFMFFLIANRNWNIRYFLFTMGCALAGFLSNVALLQFIFPDWLQVMIRGIHILSLADGGHDLLLSFNGFRWDIQRWFSANWWVYFLVIIGYSIFLLSSFYRKATTNFLVLMISFILAVLSSLTTPPTLYPIIFLVIALLFSSLIVLKQKIDFVFIGLAILLFLLPITYSWGTNISLARHSRMAFVFPLAFCLLFLQILSAKAVFNRQTYLLSLSILSLPALWFQITTWFDLNHIYRLNTPLIEQKYPISIGNPSSTIFVDAVMRDDIAFFLKMLSSVNFEKGTPILDLTGDGVGFVYAAGGKPVGMGWLLGGYPGSEKTFEYLIDSVDKTLLKSSWLMTSDDNPRHIKNWQAIWLRKLGELNHQPVGTVCLHWPYVWSNSPDKNCYEITLWKPIASVH